jgi:hypothetical protein
MGCCVPLCTRVRNLLCSMHSNQHNSRHVYCEFLAGKLKALAKKFKATKFVQIRAQDAIKGYPEKNLPTLLIYHKGDIKKQFIGISSFGGEKMTELGMDSLAIGVE